MVGIPPGLVRHFSKRRAAIEDRYTELTTEYRHAHGREPDRSTQLRLAQQATLETRDGKGVPRTMAELVADWTREATSRPRSPRARPDARHHTRPLPHDSRR